MESLRPLNNYFSFISQKKEFLLDSEIKKDHDYIVSIKKTIDAKLIEISNFNKEEQEAIIKVYINTLKSLPPLIKQVTAYVNAEELKDSNNIISDIFSNKKETMPHVKEVPDEIKSIPEQVKLEAEFNGEEQDPVTILEIKEDINPNVVSFDDKIEKRKKNKEKINKNIRDLMQSKDIDFITASLRASDNKAKNNIKEQAVINDIIADVKKEFLDDFLKEYPKNINDYLIHKYRKNRDRQIIIKIYTVFKYPLSQEQYNIYLKNNYLTENSLIKMYFNKTKRESVRSLLTLCIKIDTNNVNRFFTKQEKNGKN